VERKISIVRLPAWSRFFLSSHLQM
jgi:hypothetical protein